MSAETQLTLLLTSPAHHLGPAVLLLLLLLHYLAHYLQTTTITITQIRQHGSLTLSTHTV